MATNLEKLANDFEKGQELVKNIRKEAEAEVSNMDMNLIANTLLADLESRGVNLQDPEVQKELQDVYLKPEYLKDYGVKQAEEAIAEDILLTQEKIAGGESVQYQTMAASRAVEPFLTNDGVANFGSAFGTGNGPIGNIIHDGVDKNVFGGFGALIGQNPVNPRAVNAQGVIPALLSATKLASDEEVSKVFYSILEKAAEHENQTMDAYVYDLGYEALLHQVKESNTPKGKVASILNPSPATIHETKKNETREIKTASEVVEAWIEEKAKAANVDPDTLVIGFGLEKAAEYLDNLVVNQEPAKDETTPNFLENYLANKPAPAPAATEPAKVASEGTGTSLKQDLINFAKEKLQVRK